MIVFVVICNLLIIVSRVFLDRSVRGYSNYSFNYYSVNAPVKVRRLFLIWACSCVASIVLTVMYFIDRGLI